MSFQPIQPGFSESLIGTVEPVKLVEAQTDRDSLIEAKVSKGARGTRDYIYTIALIFISAFIFVAVVAIYDVFRSIINNYYADRALRDPQAHIPEEDLVRTEIANQQRLDSNIFFAVFAVITAIVFVTFIIFVIKYHH